MYLNSCDLVLPLRMVGEHRRHGLNTRKSKVIERYLDFQSVVKAKLSLHPTTCLLVEQSVLFERFS